MKTQILATTCTALITLTIHVSADTSPAPPQRKPDTLLQLAHAAVSQSQEVATASIQSLRNAGPAGLDALFEAHADTLNAHAVTPPDPFFSRQDAPWRRIQTALDAVGMQRDCHASHLFWFTDLEQAKAAAQETGRPILSLRLLGNLNEEYSCANSRFFRTTLYANADVSRFMRKGFVLHWKSVRPVPRITIDFGDGRRLERTITGNSIHYVLDAHGRVIDALPGLYGATAFVEGLGRAKEIARDASKLIGPDFASHLRNYHTRRVEAIDGEWQQDLMKIGQLPRALVVSNPAPASLAPTATAAASVALSKTGVEAPLLRQIQPGRDGDRTPQGAAVSEATWQAIAALHAEDSRLDIASARLVRDKTVSAAEAAQRTISKGFVEDPMIRMMQTLEHSISEDTVRNEYQLHRRFHGWFVGGSAPTDLGALNAKVYAELFLTPDSDPWLGLAPSEVFSALDGGGLIQSTATHPNP